MCWSFHLSSVIVFSIINLASVWVPLLKCSLFCLRFKCLSQVILSSVSVPLCKVYFVVHFINNLSYFVFDLGLVYLDYGLSPALKLFILSLVWVATFLWRSAPENGLFCCFLSATHVDIGFGWVVPWLGLFCFRFEFRPSEVYALSTTTGLSYLHFESPDFGIGEVKHCSGLFCLLLKFRSGLTMSLV